LKIFGEGVNKLGSSGSSVIVGRKVAVIVGVRVGGFGETPGSSVGGISVGPSVFMANGSRVAVDVGKLVTVGAIVFVGPVVGVSKIERSTASKAEHPVIIKARRSDKVFFMVPQKMYWDYCINCIRFDGIIFPFGFSLIDISPQFGSLNRFIQIDHNFLRICTFTTSFVFVIPASSFGEFAG